MGHMMRKRWKTMKEKLEKTLVNNIYAIQDS
jgi:hypothetical protein